MDDPFRELAEAHALGALDPEERASFEAHLAGCEACREATLRQDGTVGALPRDLAPVAPAPTVREQLLDLSLAPALPVDLSAHEWSEIVPGVKAVVLREDAARQMRACLVWGRPGARHPRHRHLGDENILVLQGALRDERGQYGPGEICRSRKGSIHSEAVATDEECLCYVVYYGELEMLES